jgi:hypothetical protein
VVEVAIAAIASGSFALLGVALSSWLADRREQLSFRRETALELAETERHVWQDSWIELNIQLERLDARLAFGGVPAELVSALRDASVMCWRNYRESAEIDEDEAGISRRLLEARRECARACLAHLLDEGSDRSRDELTRTAVAAVDALKADEFYSRYVS